MPEMQNAHQRAGGLLSNQQPGSTQGRQRTSACSVPRRGHSPNRLPCRLGRDWMFCNAPAPAGHFREARARRSPSSCARSITYISREILDSFLFYPWPGNVRELENVVERMVALITPGTEGDFSFSGPGVSSGWTPSFSLYERVKKDKLSFDQAVEEVEQELICLSLKEAKGNKARAARILKMKRSTYCDKVRKYRLGAHLSQFR